MALTERQRRIINPYAESVNTPTRRGVGYDYENESNKFVIDAIHESYLYFYEFPEIGKTLEGRDRTITQSDMLAYFALYPQNGQVSGNEILKISDASSINELQSIVEQLRTNQALEKYSSNTSELTYQREYRSNEERPELNQDIANLIAIPPAHSKQYKNKLRKALGLSEVQYSEEVGLDLLNLGPSVTTYISSDTNVDLYDWRKNGLPGEDNDRVYYNPVDLKYYYVKRTGRTETGAYAYNSLRLDQRDAAIETWNSYSESQRGRYNEAVETSVREILKLTGKHSEANFQNLLSKYSAPEVFSLLTYRDLRPGSRWIYCLQINSSDVNNLPDSTDTDDKPSYEEYELSSLQKAKRIIGEENKTITNVSFRVEDMLRYMFSVRNVLTEYDEKLLEEGLTPQVLNGIDLGRESDRLEAFFDFLSLFYGYNKISIEDEDLVQLFFTEDYLLDHICINGSFYYQGCGNTTYLNINEEQARIANAFSLFTPTTFSLIKNSYEIYVDVKNTTPSTRENPSEFLTKYVFPTIDLNSIKAGRLALAEAQDDAKRRRKRKNLFAKLSELSRTSPAEYDRLFSNRPLSYRMSSTLQGIDCNTGQAKAAKYALRFYQAATGKTKIRSLIRETIILLRQEIIEDETTKQRLADAERYAQNPARAIRDIENAVNQQIFCALDVLGDFIEDSFLDPIGAPPVANSLVRKTLDEPIKIEFSKQKMISLKTKQSKVYRKAIEQILLNFLKSIVAGVAKDIISALLGCGPEGNKRPASGLRNSFKKQDFGFTDLRNYVDEVDLVEIARLANLFNVNEDGQTSEATLEQIQSMLEDVSSMSTPVELQQLLDGDASSDLISHLFETLSSQQVVNYISPFSPPGVENRVVIDPNEYNTLNFSEEKIIDFFILLGEAIEGQGQFGDLPFRSPLEAYCDQRENYTDPLELNFEIPEIEAQYIDIVNSKINKINDLCNWLRDLQNIRLQLERLIASLPSMTWYDDFLQFIADISNSFAEWLAGIFANLFGKEQKRLQNREYNLYNSKLGTEIYYQLGTKLRECMINQLYRSSGGDIYFMTPSGHGSRLPFGLNENNRLPGGIGSRRNGWTPLKVYSYIWNNDSGLSRIPLPQYRNPPSRQWENYDTAYYSIVNGPAPLKRILRDEDLQGHDLLGAESLRRVYGPLNDRYLPEDEGITQLSKITNVVNGYLSAQETARYNFNGYAGASLLNCTNSSKGDIRIIFWDKDRVQPTVAYYNPRGVIHNERSIDSETQPIDENGDFDSVDYRIFNGTTIDNFTFRVNNQYQLLINDIVLPGIDSGFIDSQTNNLSGIPKLYGNFSIGLPYETPTDVQYNTGSYYRDDDIVSVQNYKQRIDETINNSVINDVGRRRMPRYITAIGKLPLEKTDDICVTQEDIFRAESAVQVLQTRMISFFMNIMPLASSYPNWGSVGTVKLITDYLYRNITNELKKREMLGPFYESIQYIKLVFPHDAEDEDYNRNPIIRDNFTPAENMENIIESIYLGMLDNISKTSEYTTINKSVFDPTDSQKSRYENTLVKFYTILEGANLANYGIEDVNQANQAKQILRQFFNGNQITKLGLLAGAYYFPIAFQIASYMIYADRGIKYANRYSDTQYRILLEAAGADDNLLTAIKGQVVQKFSSLFAGYPVTVDRYDLQIPIIYYSAEQVEERLSPLSALQDNLLQQSQRFLSIPELRQADGGNPQAQVSQYLQSYMNKVRLSLRGNENDLLEFDPIKRGYPTAGQEIQTYDVVSNNALATYNFNIQLSNLQFFVANNITNAANDYDQIRDWRNFATNSAQDFARNPLVLGTGLELSHYPVYQNIRNAPVFPSEEEIRAWWSSNEDIIVQAVLLEIENLMSDYIQWLSGTVPDYFESTVLGDTTLYDKLIESLEKSSISGYSQIIPTKFTSQEYYAVLANIGSSWVIGGASTWLSLDSSFVLEPRPVGGAANMRERGLRVLTNGVGFPQPRFLRDYLVHKNTIAQQNGFASDPQLLASVIDWWVATAATGFFASFTNTQYDSWENVVNYSKIDVEKSLLEKLIKPDE